MMKTLNNPYFVGALVLCALIYIGYMTSPIYMNNEPAEDDYVPEGLVELTEASQNTGDIQSQIDTESIQVDWLAKPTRDPFVHETDTASELLDEISSETEHKNEAVEFLVLPELRAIIINKNKRLAMLDHKIYAIGDSAESFEIINIESDYVEISGAMGLTRLMLKNKIGE